MVAAVDEPDALFAPLVLLILAVEHLVHRRKLAVEGRLPQLLVLDGQDEDAADVHQRADVVDAHVHLAVAQEEQVAHREDHRRHDDGHEGRFSADDDAALRAGVLVLQQPDAAKDPAIDRRQQRQRQAIGPAALGPEETVQLPLGAGGQLGQNKGPGADIPGLQQRDGAGEPEVKVLHRHRRRHAGDPPRQRDAARGLQKSAENQRPCRADGEGGFRAEAEAQRQGVDAHGQTLGQRRVEARDIGQRRHAPPPPMWSASAARKAFRRGRLSCNS